jgi:hypothetical protein
MKTTQTQAQTKDPESASAPARPLPSIPPYSRLRPPANWEPAPSSLLTVADRLNAVPADEASGNFATAENEEKERQGYVHFSANATQMGGLVSPRFPLHHSTRLFGHFTQDKGRKMQGSDVNGLLGGAERVCLAAGAGPVSG